MNFSLHRSALGLSVRVHIWCFSLFYNTLHLFFCRESWIDHSESGTDCWGLPREESAAIQRGGCFTNVSRALQNILSKFMYCRSSTSMKISSWNFVHVPNVMLWAHVQSFIWNSHHKCHFNSIHCGLMTPYGDRHLGRYILVQASIYSHYIPDYAVSDSYNFVFVPCSIGQHALFQHIMDPTDQAKQFFRDNKHGNSIYRISSFKELCKYDGEKENISYQPRVEKF